MLRLTVAVAAMSDVVGKVAALESIEQLTAGIPKAFHCSLFGFADERFQFAEGLFDRIEVGTVGREIEQMRARRLDSGPHRRTLVARKIVHHHDVTGLECGHEHLVDIGLEGDAVDRPVEQPSARPCR